jgi:hypothetical protein
LLRPYVVYRGDNDPSLASEAIYKSPSGAKFLTRGAGFLDAGAPASRVLISVLPTIFTS